jgi:predicted nucleic acid-binding protein
VIRAYLDSSTFLKQFNEEKGSEVAHKLFVACENGKIELATSQWTIGETIAAIDRKIRRNEITEEVRDVNIKFLLELTGQLAHKKCLMIIPLDQYVVSASWKYITSDHLSADDAVQLLSFMMINSEAFLASDKYLLDAIKQEGIDCYDIEDEKDRAKIIKRLEG